MERERRERKGVRMVDRGGTVVCCREERGRLKDLDVFSCKCI